MSKFKLFFQCCCHYFKEVEEEKKQGLNKIESFHNKSALDVQSFIQGNLEDSSIIAAPDPHMDGSSSEPPKLQIKIIESTAVSVGTTLLINSTGMENSKRNKLDFKTFIGSKLSENGEVVNDFTIDEGTKGMGGQHLVIKYNPSRLKYSITDLGDGSGTFVKIDSLLQLKDGYIISFGNSHMTIHYSSAVK